MLLIPVTITCTCLEVVPCYTIVAAIFAYNQLLEKKLKEQAF